MYVHGASLYVVSSRYSYIGPGEWNENWSLRGTVYKRVECISHHPVKITIIIIMSIESLAEDKLRDGEEGMQRVSYYVVV